MDNKVNSENRLRVTTGPAGSAPSVQTPAAKAGAFSKILRREDLGSGGGGSEAGYGRQAAHDPLSRPQSAASPARTASAGVATRQDRMAGFIKQHSMVPPQSGQIHGASMLKAQDMVPLGRATAAPAQAPSGAETRYEVKAGDNLWKIARDNNMDWRDLARHNNISNPSLIQVGQQILIPAAGAASSAPAQARPTAVGASPSGPPVGLAGAATGPRPVQGSAAGVGEARATAKFNVSPGAGPVPFAAKAPAARPAGAPAPFARPAGPAPQPLGAPQAAAAPRPAAAPVGFRGPTAPQAAPRPAPMGPPAPAARAVGAPGVGPAAAAGTDPLKAFGLDNAKVDQIIDRTSKYEGDYTSLNKNTDKAGLSFGFIQFAQKPGSLGQVLTSMSRQNPAKFKQIFGPDAEQMLKVVTKAPDHGLDANGRATNPKFDLTREPWVGRFEAAGRDTEFQGVQRSVARKSYFNPMLETAQKYDIKSPEGLSMLFDTSVQQGRSGMERILRTAAKKRTPGMTERQFLEVVAKTAAKAAGPRWQSNVLNRRMGILNDANIAKLGQGQATA